MEGFKEWLESNGHAKLRVSTIKKHHVTRWLAEAKPKASQGYLHNIIRAIKAPFLWAHSEEYIERLPLRKLKPGKATARDIDITPDQWEKIIAKTRDPEFLVILWTLRLTGCRPQELRLVQVRQRHGSEASSLPSVPLVPGEIDDQLFAEPLGVQALACLFCFDHDLLGFEQEVHSARLGTIARRPLFWSHIIEVESQERVQQVLNVIFISNIKRRRTA